MLEARLKQVEAVVWDVDGVVYDFHSLTGTDAAMLFDKSAVDAAMHLLPRLDIQDAFAIASVGYKKYGGSYMGFEDHAVKAGYGVDEFRHAVFKEFHRRCYHSLTTRFPKVCARNEELIEAFGSAPHLRHGVASHACRDQWIIPLFERIGILPFFPDEHIWGRAQVNFANKAHNPVAVQSCMKGLGTTPQKTAFFEDTPENMERAKDVIGGSLVTMFIHAGHPLERLPSYIDLQVPDARSALLALSRS